MLENIKMLLGIKPEDASKDNIINYWIKFYSNMVIKYCHITELSEELNGIVEQMIITKMGGVGSQGDTSSKVDDNVKSITRGDYSITFKESASDKNKTNGLDNIALNFQGQLNLFRRFDY